MSVRKIKNLATPSVLVDSQSGTDISEDNPLPVTITSVSPTPEAAKVKKLKNLVTPVVLVASETGQNISESNPLPIRIIGGGTGNLPVGGLTGEYLVKLSDSDYDVGWAQPSATQLTVTLEASENISAMKLVAPGLVLADSSVSGRQRVIGVARDFIASGDSGVVITDGVIEDASFSFTIGSALYLGASGNLTEVAPTTGFWVRVGTAVKTNAFKLELQMEPIVI